MAKFGAGFVGRATVRRQVVAPKPRALEAPAAPTGDGPFQQKAGETSSIRARVEHVFRVIKRQFGYTKVRYKGIAKNAAQVFSLIGLTNLYLARRALMN